MKHLLYLILLSVLLTSAIYSCRSAKQTATEYSDTTSVSVLKYHGKLTNNDVLSLFSSTHELDLSGVRLEFFPPDSAHPDARAAPKALTIESAKAKDTSEQATQESTNVDEQKTVNLSAQSSASMQQKTRGETDIFRPPKGLCLMLALLAIGFIFFFIKRDSS